MEPNLEPGKCPVALAPVGPTRASPVGSKSSSRCISPNVLEQVSPAGSTLKLTWKVSRGFGARRPRRSFPVGSKSSSRCVSPARSFHCWVEQVSPAGSTGNLTWNPLSVPGALAPGGSGRRSSQREGYNGENEKCSVYGG